MGGSPSVALCYSQPAHGVPLAPLIHDRHRHRNGRRLLSSLLASLGLLPAGHTLRLLCRLLSGLSLPGPLSLDGRARFLRLELEYAVDGVAAYPDFGRDFGDGALAHVQEAGLASPALTTVA